MITTKYCCVVETGVPGIIAVVSWQQVPKVGLVEAPCNPDKFMPGAPPTSVHRLMEVVPGLRPSTKPKATLIWLTLPLITGVNSSASSTHPTPEFTPLTVQPEPAW